MTIMCEVDVSAECFLAHISSNVASIFPQRAVFYLFCNVLVTFVE